jgi:hypothetical protein
MMATDYLKTSQLHRAPTFSLVVDGRDISKNVEARMVSLTLTEARGGEADQLDLVIDDSDGRMGNRRHAKKVERVCRGLWIMRPIAEWTAEQAFAIAQARGINPNPLYLQGMTRVGCMPCINVNKGELRQIALRFPEHPLRISEWERIVGMCAKRGFSTFIADAHSAIDRRKVFADLNIWARIEWSKTTRGGRQFDLLQVLDEPSACSSAYGLCE